MTIARTLREGLLTIVGRVPHHACQSRRCRVEVLVTTRTGHRVVGRAEPALDGAFECEASIGPAPREDMEALFVRVRDGTRTVATSGGVFVTDLRSNHVDVEGFDPGSPLTIRTVFSRPIRTGHGGDDRRSATSLSGLFRLSWPRKARIVFEPGEMEIS